MIDPENGEIKIATTVDGSFASTFKIMPVAQPEIVARIGHSDYPFMQMCLKESEMTLRVCANGVIELNGEMVNDEPEKIVEFLQSWGRLVVPTIA